jgi:hypothetical protein
MTPPPSEAQLACGADKAGTGLEGHADGGLIYDDKGNLIIRAENSAPGCVPPAAPGVKPAAVSPDKCDYTDMTGLSYPTSTTDAATTAELGAKRDAGQKFIYWSCHKPDGTPYYGADWVDPNAGAGDPATRGEFEAAARTVTLPGPVARLWPPAGKQVVNVDTWLHVDSTDPAHVIPFTTPLAADVSTTRVLTSAAATATQVTWTFAGDAKGTPAPVRCTNAGKVWVEGATGTDCAVRFYKSGAGTATVAITYTILWVSTTGEWGVLNDVARTATFDYRVDGYEAIIR